MYLPCTEKETAQMNNKIPILIKRFSYKGNMKLTTNGGVS